jgi:hypothetical protein
MSNHFKNRLQDTGGILTAFLSVLEITFTSQMELPILSDRMPEDTECPIE